MIYLGVFILGIVSGLRTFTGLAVFFLSRGGVAGVVAALFAAGEYVADALPAIPPRTTLVPLTLRSLGGLAIGWLFASAHGAPGIAGALLGFAGAQVGTFGGYRLRMALIASIGAIPAAIVEDVVAIAIAALVILKIF